MQPINGSEKAEKWQRESSTILLHDPSRIGCKAFSPVDGSINELSQLLTSNLGSTRLHVRILLNNTQF